MGRLLFRSLTTPENVTSCAYIAKVKHKHDASSLNFNNLSIIYVFIIKTGTSSKICGKDMFILLRNSDEKMK